MRDFFGILLLPFRIFGVPFVVAIVSSLRLPSQRDIVAHADRREEPRHRPA